MDSCYDMTVDKKAKSFDFMAMFEEARKTAVERSHDTLGVKYSSDMKDKCYRECVFKYINYLLFRGPR